ncbi:MAG: DNA mismatch repair protein MutS, partial [Bdellovibrionia bacterium]
MTISTTSTTLASDDQTPLMKQYNELKAQAPGALLLFRMGDFYEMFGDDAVVAAGILEITLTSRDRNKPNPMPMAGVPHHSVQGYIQKLLRAGKKIAIGEQMEDPALVKGTSKIVRREIVRILTPGVQFDAEGYEANYLATVTTAPGSKWVLTCLDASTGEALVSAPISLESLNSELRRLSVRHFLHLTPQLDLAQFGFSDSVLVENLPKNYISLEKATEVLRRHYELENLGSFIRTDSGTLGLGTLVTYVLRTQLLDRLAHLRLPEALHKPKCLVLGGNTAQHLDLIDLFKIVNQTRSTLGTRQLKNWMFAPLRNPAEIADRQTAIREIAGLWTRLGEKLSSYLSHVYDLERIAGRINTGLASPRDTLALGQSLVSLRSIGELLKEFQAPLLIELKQGLDGLATLLGPMGDTIVRTQREDAPLVSRDGGVFNRGTTPELDHLISLTEDGQRWLVDLENRERQLTGIPSLKVRYNRVFGYYIEITQSHLKNVPSHYQRKQTMVGAERFFTDELKKFEEEIVTASVKQKSLEQVLFNEMIEEIKKLTPPIMDAARKIGEVDSLASLARLSMQPNWCFPVIEDGLELDIRAGRHPMVDLAKRGGFVPNDVSLSQETRLTLLITGPNMGGKSTVMRQTALIVILGQMGAPVPAIGARWGSVSSIYTRIGAQDAIARGQSTFMVEMSELADILHHADKHSLIILDEIGRGTSTYDGISVAWATLEWICTKIRARTFFATHYHELIRLASTLPLLANAHMAVAGTRSASQKTLRFLYELREGPTNESFGIHVAQLAGLPKPVIDRAWKVLEELESHTGASGSAAQLHLFDSPKASQQIPFEENLEENLGESSDLEVSPMDQSSSEPHPVLKELG